ncbi:MAG TPA: PQQ-binding-like beta-propeller repeat protein [Solirubrobacterales bacterium]|nr:PQQ-binding-like beta-propeller repeat protein [Solirubrobacterales bacterium]
MCSRCRSLSLACLVAVLGTLALAGCGDSEPLVGDKANATKKTAGYIGWPMFGRVPERTHYLPTEKKILDPPLRKAWSINTHALIEFPPAISDGVAYAVNKYGNAAAVRLRDRKVLWRRATDPSDKGKPTDVTAPVYSEGKVFFAFLNGDLVAVDAGDGHEVWKRNLDAHLESSPMVVGGTLYVGTDKTNVVALETSDGSVRWQFNSPGAIKASPSYHDGRLFVADYEGGVFCLDAGSGKPIWRTNTTRVAPFGKGGFYSSPAIGFGRVYAARDDGTVFAFDEKSGKVSWSFPTGDYVYGSPAIGQVPGTPPSLYIGAENGRFFALHALNGKRRWHYDVGGPVPGTATLIGRTVYTSSFKTREAIGIDVITRKKTFELKDAGYTPVVSDGKKLYLVGYYTLVGLEPLRR